MREGALSFRVLRHLLLSGTAFNRVYSARLEDNHVNLSGAFLEFSADGRERHIIRGKHWVLQ